MIMKASHDILPFLNEQLDAHTQSMGKQPLPSYPIALALELDGQLKGGASGTLTGQNFHLSLLTVDPNHRGQGYGHQLLTAIEAQARAKGATLFTCTTFAHQALHFYQAHDYQIFGKLANCPVAGMQKYYLSKDEADHTLAK